MSNLSPQEISAIKKEIFSSLHCALPGVVVSYDANTKLATIKPSIKQSDIAMPLINDVPVYMPFEYDIQENDMCMLIFSDCNIDAWWSDPTIVSKPGSNRMHSLSDAIALVGFGVSGSRAIKDDGAARKTEAIKSIVKSGNDYIATRCDGTTFTF